MFKQELKDKYQFLTNYFEQGLKNVDKSIAHSILFYGQDVSAQYDLAVEIARLLNCNEFKNATCQCLNCKWIRNKEHPAVLTISKIDSKPSDDNSSTVISVKQALMVKNSLLNTSEYHRVFIFCDAKKEGENWIPSGLNEQNFQEEAANTLLKIIEEPPPNTTFFFLTRDKNDLIGTIVSRSQSFYVPSYNIEDNEFSLVENLLEDYPQIERKDSIDLSQKLLSLAKEAGNEKVLDQVQNFLLALLKSNALNQVLASKVLEDVKNIEVAKKMLSKNMNPQSVFDDLCLKLAI